MRKPRPNAVVLSSPEHNVSITAENSQPQSKVNLIITTMSPASLTKTSHLLLLSPYTLGSLIWSVMTGSANQLCLVSYNCPGWNLGVNY